MPVLTIAVDDVIKTARLSVASTTDQADAAFVVSFEQSSIEATIDPAALAEVSILPLLTRCVMKLLAAELLDMRSRADGATGTYQGGGITLGQEWDHPSRLRAEAREDLAPYLLAHGNKTAVFVGPESSLTSLPLQDRLFGRTEAQLRSRDSEDCF